MKHQLQAIPELPMPQVISIYMLTDPTGARTCYVGRSRKPEMRVQQQLCDPSNPRMLAWMRALKTRGFRPTLNVLDTCSEQDAVIAETDAIAIVKAVRGVDCLNQ